MVGLVYSTFTFNLSSCFRKIKFKKMREIRNTAVQVQNVDRFKDQMNQNFDFFFMPAQF